MIAYKAPKSTFLRDAPTIEDKIRAGVKEKLGIDIKVGSSEYESWKNSVGNAMFHVINNSNLPDDSEIAIEYKLAGSKMRIDFLISGKNRNNRNSVVIVELKQWSEIELGLMRHHVKTFMGRAKVERQHPSYQADSYAISLRNFNPAVEVNGIDLNSCAYLHNCMQPNVIKSSDFDDLTSKSPVFIKGESELLSGYLERHIVKGDTDGIIERLESSPIEISKSLSQNIGSMIKGNSDFALIDDQKTVLEEILYMQKNLVPGQKNVMIIEGGPGTGKSLIAINALVESVKQKINARYVTNNSAPRKVYLNQLAGSRDKSEIESLFIGPDPFLETDPDFFDLVLVDEAHRLTANWGFYKTKGESQVKEIIEASKMAVFFIDELQKVTWNDLGTISEIEYWCNKFGIKAEKRILDLQFRCAGSDSYINWVNRILNLSTSNEPIENFESFDFQIVDDPVELKDLIFEKNKVSNRARMLAGYCWNWVSKKEPEKFDISFPEFDFDMKWNLASDPTWIISPESVNQIGCIHTSQGLETDYVGVIVGPDLVARNGKLITDPNARAKSDQSMKGWKKAMTEDPVTTEIKTDQLIRNTYRALLTRGMKGCYIYSTDSETQEYFKSQLPGSIKDF